MKKILILFFVTGTIFANEIDFDKVLESARKNSKDLINLSEDMELEEMALNKESYPRRINFSTSLSPSLSVGSEGFNYDIGAIGFTVSPFYGASLGVSHIINRQTLLGSWEWINPKDNYKIGQTILRFSYSPLDSMDSLNSAKAHYKIGQTSYKEKEDELLKSIKNLYISLYYTRKLYELDKKEFKLLKRDLEISLNKVETGLKSRISHEDLSRTLLEQETNLFNGELELLRLEEDLSLITNLDIRDYQLKEYTPEALGNPRFKPFKESSEYLQMIESVRASRESLKDSKRGWIPSVSLNGEVSTTDFKDFNWKLSLMGNFSFTLDYLDNIKKAEISLSQRERDLEFRLKRAEQEEMFSKRELEIRERRIEILKLNYESSLNNLKILKYSLDSGDILKEDYEKAEIRNTRVKLDLDRAIASFNIDYY